MKRLYKLIATAGILGGLMLPATVTCVVPDIDVKFVPGYGDDYGDDHDYDDDYDDDYYDDCCDDCCGGWWDFGFDFWSW